MHARVTRLEASAERLDVLLGDRRGGGAMAVTYWASEEAMQASEDAVTQERERAAETAEAAAGPTSNATR